MIEINLIPTHLRKKDSRGPEAWVFINLPKEFILGCGSLFILLIILIHLILLSVWFAKSAQFAVSEMQWQRMTPDKNSIDSINKEIKDLRTKLTMIADSSSKKTIVWSQKLNIISDALPKGVWLKKIDWNDKILKIEGYSYAKAHDEINIVGAFLSTLKKDANFMKDFSSIELNSITRIKKGMTEVAVFTITVKVKENTEAASHVVQNK